MLSLFAFLGSSAGRWTRAIAGVVLIAVGLFAVGGTAGYIVAIVGLAPLAAGVFDVCLFAPIAGLPFGGALLRTETARRMKPHASAR